MPADPPTYHAGDLPPEAVTPTTKTPGILAEARAAGRLLLTPREAAAALAVCQRTLWAMTQRGLVPCVRVGPTGRGVRYDPADLRAFIERSKGGAES